MKVRPNDDNTQTMRAFAFVRARLVLKRLVEYVNFTRNWCVSLHDSSAHPPHSEGMRGIAISVSVCLSVCSLIQESHEFKLHEIFSTCWVMAGSSSDDSAYMLRTSGFVDDVMFSHNGRSELFTASRQVAPLNCACAAKSLQIRPIVHN